MALAIWELLAEIRQHEGLEAIPSPPPSTLEAADDSSAPSRSCQHRCSHLSIK